MNNWAVEISPYRIQFKYIKGIKNTLADTMSRLIQIDPEARLQPEQEGYEFGYHAFEDMEPIKCEVSAIDTVSPGDPIPLPVVLPQILTSAVLQLAHEGLGHNGSPRTYTLIKRHYYWKGLKPMVKKHVQTCKLCQEHNKQVVKYSKINSVAEPAPMKFISMDLIGEFHPPSSKGNRYALTVICMFTGYTFCILIPNKMAKTVLKAHMDNVYCQFGGSN